MLRLIITLPFLILLVVFVVDNTTSGVMELPYLSWQSSAGVAVLVAAVVFYLLGAVSVWFAELRQRRRARRAEQQLRVSETQVSELRTQLGQSVAQNVAYHGTTAAAVTTSPTMLPPALP